MSGGRQEIRRARDDILDVLGIVAESHVDRNINDLVGPVKWPLHSESGALVERQVERRFSPKVERRTGISPPDGRLDLRDQRVGRVAQEVGERELPQHCAPLARTLEIAEALHIRAHRQQMRVWVRLRPRGVPIAHLSRSDLQTRRRTHSRPLAAERIRNSGDESPLERRVEHNIALVDLVPLVRVQLLLSYRHAVQLRGRVFRTFLILYCLIKVRVFSITGK